MDEETNTEQQQVHDEAQDILDGFAESLIQLEVMRGAFIGAPSQEAVADYLISLERVAAFHESINGILAAVRVSSTIDRLGEGVVEAAHTAAYKRLFPERDRD